MKYLEFKLNVAESLIKSYKLNDDEDTSEEEHPRSSVVPLPHPKKRKMGSSIELYTQLFNGIETWCIDFYTYHNFFPHCTIQYLLMHITYMWSVSINKIIGNKKNQFILRSGLKRINILENKLTLVSEETFNDILFLKHF